MRYWTGLEIDEKSKEINKTGLNRLLKEIESNREYSSMSTEDAINQMIAESQHPELNEGGTMFFPEYLRTSAVALKIEEGFVRVIVQSQSLMSLEELNAAIAVMSDDVPVDEIIGLQDGLKLDILNLNYILDSFENDEDRKNLIGVFEESYQIAEKKFNTTEENG